MGRASNKKWSDRVKRYNQRPRSLTLRNFYDRIFGRHRSWWRARRAV